MGRFASTVEFYARFREPYPAAFFQKVAGQLGLRGGETLLDVGCGPGLLALGFAPYVGSCTGIDPEPAMIEAARKAAEKAGIALSLFHGRVEELSSAHAYDLVTIGRALHWLDRQAALAVLERIVSASGRILICRSSGDESQPAPWLKAYEEVRRSYALEPHEHRYRLDGKTWFEGSCFHEARTISLTTSRPVTMRELIGRALSKSNTSPAVLGRRRQAFESEIIAALEPFAANGLLQERIVARAAVFARQRRIPPARSS